MSKVFYDKLASLGDVEKAINKLAETNEEKEELWHIIDEYVHHRMLGCILTKLPREHHEEFLTKFTEAPHHDDHIKYLQGKIPHDIETFLREELYSVGSELLEVIKGKKKSKK